MLEPNAVTVRSVNWWAVCPWLTILRTFRMAISLRVLSFGALGMSLTLLGWWALSQFFLGGESLDNAWWQDRFVHSAYPATAIDGAVPDAPELPLVTEGLGTAERSWDPADPFFGAWAELSRPIWLALIKARMEPALLACLTFSALWALAVWSFFGAAISRVAAVHLATDERVGWGAAMRYASSKWLSYFAAPLFPLFGILLVVIPLLLLGLIMRSGVGLFLVALIWPLLLIGGLVMAMLLLGLIFGWPLMWATISAEGTDTFDALSRSYAYTFQRPLRYLFYALVAAVFGWLGWLLVRNFAAGIIWMSFWGTSWGSGADRLLEIRGGAPSGFGGAAGAAVIGFWAGCVKWLAFGFVYGYFWTASTSIYFLLRRDVDATEMDEVFVDADESEQSYGLPTLAIDESGSLGGNGQDANVGARSGEAEPVKSTG